MNRYRFALGNSLHGPVELVVEVQAERPGVAITRLADLIARSWGGLEIPLEGLERGESARLLVNPAYFTAPERVDQPTLTESP